MFSSAPFSALPFTTAGGTAYFSSAASSATSNADSGTAISARASVSTAGWNRGAWNRGAWQETSTGPVCSDTIIGKSPINTHTQTAASGAEAVYASAGFVGRVLEDAAGSSTAQTTAAFLCSAAASATAASVVSTITSFLSSTTAAAAGTDAARAGVAHTSQIAESITVDAASSSSFVYIVYTADTVQVQDVVVSKLVLVLSTSAAALLSAGNSASIDVAGKVAEYLSGQQAVDARVAFSVAFSGSVQITDVALLRALWEVIDDSQTVNWQNMLTATEGDWGTLDTAQSGSWQVVQAPTTSWGTIENEQPSVWVVIPTLKGE